ncbi:MAG: glycosyltransferase family 4 protein, partial [Nitrososphaerota archaeon]|nr:glycosyltransferase family 4 protein [Nitrososphaerota archaeon]
MPLYPVSRFVGSPVSITADYQGEYFSSAGNKVTVVTGFRGQRKPSTGQDSRFEIIGIPVVQLHGSLGRILTDLIYSLRAVFIVQEQLKSKADVIFYHSYPTAFFAALFGIANRKLRRRAFVQHASLEQIGERSVAIASQSLKRYALPRVRMILTQNRAIKEELATRFKVNPNRIVVLPICAGLDTAVFRRRPANFSVKRKLGFDETDKMIVCVGSISPGKNQLTLLRAFAALLNDVPNAKMVFIGRVSSQEYYHRIMDFVHGNPFVEHEVLTLGFVESYEELSEFYNAADVCALVVLEEGGLHRSIMEAMACGKACVVAKSPFNEEYVDSSESRLVDPRNVKSIENALRELLTDSEANKSTGQRAMK